MSRFNILTEVPPISQADTFVLFGRKKKEFDYPIHIHNEFELNFITGAKGATRVVGDNVAELEDKELVLIGGSYLEHAWYNGNVDLKTSNIYEVTIQFRPDLFHGGFIERKQFAAIKKMMDDAKHGIAFSQSTIAVAEDIIGRMTKSDDEFDSILLFLSLLNTLARDEYKILSHSIFSRLEVNYDSRRVNKVMEYMNNNYTRNIKLSEIAGLVNMSEASFSRFIKLRTGQSFVDCLNGMRISVASRMLIQEPTRTISEVAFKCGFNNLSNFNRIFKKKKGHTPHDFREHYVHKKIII